MNLYRSHAEVVWVGITVASFYMFFINVYLEGQKAKKEKNMQGTVSFLSTLVLGLGFYVQFNFNRGSSTTLAPCIKVGHEFALPPIVKGY